VTSSHWDEKYRDEELIWTAQPNRFLVEEVADLVPGRALDVACGEGRNAVWLATRGWEVTGVDFSPVGIDKARRLAAATGVEVEWTVADVAGWEPPADRFQLVAVLYLHVGPSQRRAALERAAGAVEPGGVLLVVGHALRNLTEGYGGPPDADLLYAPDEVVAEIPGLRIERAEEVLRPVATAGGTGTAIDTLIRARRVQSGSSA